MEQLWHDVLYRPLLNILVALYQYAAGENLGIAVIELTLIIRIVLLPFSIVSEQKQSRLEALSRKLDELGRAFKNDAVKQRFEARKLLKEHRVNPWAKIVVLGVQVLVLVLLYQVFVSGMRAETLGELYSFIQRPDFVNTHFLGFDIAVQNRWWSIAVGVVLFMEIAVVQHGRRNMLKRRDIFYRYAFPIASVVVLMQLPMVKSIFILTSMAFGALLFGIRKGVS